MQTPATSSLGADPIAKISRRLLPLLALGYGVAYIDRVNLSFAALQMNQDLHFSAEVYGLGAGLFSLGYCLLEIPSNLLLVRVGARRWISRIMVTWGLLAIGMLFVRTPLQFYVMRLLLGIAEAGFFPGVLFYLRQWYPPEYTARAVSRFYVAVPLGAACMGGLSGALLSLNGSGGLAGWQWLFLIEGLPAVLLGLVIFFFLPDSPAQAHWLDDTDRAWLASRMGDDPPSRSQSWTAGLRVVLAMPLVWALGCCNFLILGANYAFAFSAPAVLKAGTGWNAQTVGWFMSATGLIGGAAMLANGWHSDRVSERHLHVAAPLALMAAMQWAIAASHSAAVLLPAYVLYYMGVYAVQAAFWPIPSAALRGRDAAVGLAAIGSIGIFGGFAGPYLWGLARQHTGTFVLGHLCVGASLLLAGVLVIKLRRTDPGVLLVRP
jgi:MFS transporter, ACS family, tartrate transporter